MRKIDEIFIHCTATQPGWMGSSSAREKIAEIDRWHRKRGWKGFGYHYLIDRNGECATGRPLEQIGAHVRGHNSGSIGISLVGGHGAAATDAFSDHFTPAQRRALLELIDYLQANFPGAVVRGHNEVAAKGCPGFPVQPWLERVRQANQLRREIEAKAEADLVQHRKHADGLLGMIRRLLGR